MIVYPQMPISIEDKYKTDRVSVVPAKKLEHDEWGNVYDGDGNYMERHSPNRQWKG